MLSGSGNVNNGSQIKGEVIQKTYVDHGQRLAEEAGKVVAATQMELLLNEQNVIVDVIAK